MPPRFQLALWMLIGVIVAWLSAALFFVISIKHGAGTPFTFICAPAVVVVFACYATSSTHALRRRLLIAIAVCFAVTLLSPGWAAALELEGNFLFSFVPAFFGVINRFLLLTMTLISVVLLFPFPGKSMIDNESIQQATNRTPT